MIDQNELNGKINDILQRLNDPGEVGYDIHPDDLREAKSEIVSYITGLMAERERVARIDELKLIETAQQNTDQWGGFCIDDTSDFSNYIGERIAELTKAKEQKL